MGANVVLKEQKVRIRNSFEKISKWGSTTKGSVAKIVDAFYIPCTLSSSLKKIPASKKPAPATTNNNSSNIEPGEHLLQFEEDSLFLFYENSKVLWNFGKNMTATIRFDQKVLPINNCKFNVPTLKFSFTRLLLILNFSQFRFIKSLVILFDWDSDHKFFKNLFAILKILRIDLDGQFCVIFKSSVYSV